MINSALHSRCARAALAAALAFSTTPLLAQEAGIDPLAPTPPVETPAEEPAAAIPTSEPVTAAPAPAEETVAEPTATAVTPEARTSRPRAAERTAAPMRASTVGTAQPETSRLAPEGAEAAAMATPEPVAAPAPLPSEPASADAASLVDPDEGAMWAAAGALALFGFAGAALVGRRRRKVRTAETVSTPWSEPPRAKMVRQGGFVTAASATRSTERTHRPAFAWGRQAEQPVMVPADGDRIAAAYRGPTPDNPSLSLKKRLKRATFFEARDRAVRAGKAVPVSPHAGLPRRLADNVRSAMRPVAARSHPALQPA